MNSAHGILCVSVIRVGGVFFLCKRFAHSDFCPWYFRVDVSTAVVFLHVSVLPIGILPVFCVDVSGAVDFLHVSVSPIGILPMESSVLMS